MVGIRVESEEPAGGENEKEYENENDFAGGRLSSTADAGGAELWVASSRSALLAMTDSWLVFAWKARSRLEERTRKSTRTRTISLEGGCPQPLMLEALSSGLLRRAPRSSQ